MITNKEINKIYKKVDEISKGGKDNFLQYYKYIDELLENSEYGIFSDMMLRKYNIDISKYKSVDEMKRNTFEDIRFLTLTYDQEELKALYQSNEIYQIGFYIYTIEGVLLGEIREIEENSIINLLVIKDRISTKIEEGDTLIEKYESAILILKN